MHKSFLLLGGILAAIPANGRPLRHVVVVMCDDMGFSDLGCYGGEIHTPNIDSLAARGVRFSQFKNCSRSCPSRASLLTGMYSHEVGMGWMTNADERREGYRGQIDDEHPTMAELFREAGYHTYMSGKWHVTRNAAYDAPNGSYPTQRGFERYYGCLAGGGSYYRPTPLYHQLERIDSLPDDYYYTNAITDSAVNFVRQHPADQPMFLYVAHFAPHLPLQAPEERVEKWMRVYERGYDVLREERFERQVAMGLFSDTLQLPVYQREFGGKRPAWDSLTKQQQERWTRDMATYAAMIEIMDEGIGRLVCALREKGLWEDTALLFLSDNGASSEGGRWGQLMADLSNTPFRSYKQWTLQGGTSSPLILTFGRSDANTQAGQISPQLCHIIDLLPTCLDWAGVKIPSHLQGRSILKAATQGKRKARTLFFEHQSSCAVIDGVWKLVRYDENDAWQLFLLTSDPFETRDLAHRYPKKVRQLEQKWLRWAERGKVLPLDHTPWGKRIERYK